MKANELQLGDYVNYRGQIIKVTSLYDKGGSNEVGWGIKEETWVNAINVEPIPLTRKILEKNGFVNDDNNYGLRYYQSCGDIIGVDIRGDIGYLEDADLKYVHRLQHALRLCGIEKEIEL